MLEVLVTGPSLCVITISGPNLRGVPQAESENAYFPVLVIAIRGSASMVDHMANANERPRAATQFVVLPESCLITPNVSRRVKGAKQGLSRD
jgi:hypothetical protein